MKNWTWKTWATVGVFCAIFLAAAILLVVGISTHTEPGFTAPNRRWEELPLLVYCTGYVEADDDACSTAEDVVGVINHRLGFDMLQWSDNPTNVDIIVTMRAPVEVGEAERDIPGGFSKLRYGGTGGAYGTCEVQTMNVSGGAGNLEWLALYHEIGCHCLGLAHDDYKQSICYPVQEATPSRTIPAWISDWDRALLREKYKP